MAHRGLLPISRALYSAIESCPVGAISRIAALQQAGSTPSPPLFLEVQQRSFWPSSSPSQQEATDDEDTRPHSATELAGLAAKLADTGAQPPGTWPPTDRGPLTAYQEGREEGMLRADPLQEATIVELQRLFDDLRAFYPRAAPRASGRGLTLVDAGHAEPATARPWWKSLFGSESTDLEAASRQGPDSTPAVRGLYMFGGVGCGKTMLMDLFASCAGPEFKLVRTHFHDFMLDIHSRLRAHQSTQDPLSLVADEVASSTRVLCLDEFFVTDVADAMILHRLFARLWDDGLVLVATSNRRPDALYEGGLQRALFMPFIHRLKRACMVHDMASPTDYRRLAQHRGGLYFTGKDQEEELQERFLELANRNEVVTHWVEVAMGRRLEMPRTGGCITHFHFDDLCGRPLGAADYIAVANSKHTIALSGVPVFTASNRTAAYRFVTLIDVLYEHRVRLLCSAEAMPTELFANIMTNEEAKAKGGGKSQSNLSAEDTAVVDDNLGFSKDRTVSRLTEMQSKEYLRAHAMAHAPELLYALEEGAKREATVGR